MRRTAPLNLSYKRRVGGGEGRQTLCRELGHELGLVVEELCAYLAVSNPLGGQGPRHPTVRQQQLDESIQDEKQVKAYKVRIGSSRCGHLEEGVG